MGLIPTQSGRTAQAASRGCALPSESGRECDSESRTLALASVRPAPPNQSARYGHLRRFLARARVLITKLGNQSNRRYFRRFGTSIGRTAAAIAPGKTWRARRARGGASPDTVELPEKEQKVGAL